MFWFSGQEACGIFASQPGIEPSSPAMEGEVLTTGLLGKYSPLSPPAFLLHHLPTGWLLPAQTPLTSRPKSSPLYFSHSGNHSCLAFPVQSCPFLTHSRPPPQSTSVLTTKEVLQRGDQNWASPTRNCAHSEITKLCPVRKLEISRGKFYVENWLNIGWKSRKNHQGRVRHPGGACNPRLPLGLKGSWGEGWKQHPEGAGLGG